MIIIISYLDGWRDEALTNTKHCEQLRSISKPLCLLNTLIRRRLTIGNIPQIDFLTLKRAVLVVSSRTCLSKYCVIQVLYITCITYSYQQYSIRYPLPFFLKKKGEEKGERKTTGKTHGLALFGG